MGGRVYYTRHMDKTKGESGSKGGRRVWLGWGKMVGGKCRQVQLNNHKIILKNNKKKSKWMDNG